MEFNRQTMKNLFGLVAFGVLLHWGIHNMNRVGTILGYTVGLIAPFLLGSCIAFILNVPMRRIETFLFPHPTGKQKKYKRAVSLVLTLFLLTALLCIIFFLIVPEVSNSINMLAKNVVTFLKNFQTSYPDLYEQFIALIPTGEQLARLDWESIAQKAFSFVKIGAGSLINSTVNIASQILSGMLTFVLGFVFSIYVLLQKEQLAAQTKKLLYAYLPQKKADEVVSIGKLSDKIFSNFLSGQCVEAVILGVMFFISMTIFRFPYALMVSVLITVTALIPIFGAFIGCVVGAFMILMTDPIKMLWFIVLFLVLQQLEGNLIYPKVVGNSVGLPSIWVLVSVTVGGSAMGVVGMLIFIPLCSVLYVLLRQNVYSRLKERNIPKKKLM